MQQKSVTLLNTGMNRDLSVSKVDKSAVYENRNIRIIARDQDTLLSVTNERGTKVASISGQIEGELVGWNVLNEHVILFTHDSNGVDHIYRADYTGAGTSSSSHKDKLKVTPTRLVFDKAGSTETLTITGEFTSWSISSAPNWTDASGKEGDTATISITATANDTVSARGGNIVVLIDGVKYTVYAYQATRLVVLSVSPSSISRSSTESAQMMTVTDTAPQGWRLACSVAWLNFGTDVGGTGYVIADQPAITGSGGTSRYVYMDPNMTGSSRTGYIYLYNSEGTLYQTVTVTQQG